MNPKRLLFMILTAALVLAACAPAATTTISPEGSGGSTDGYAVTDGVVPSVQTGTDGSKAAGAPPPIGAQATERLVIRNANLSLIVGNPVEASARINSLAASLGGYVVSSNVYQASVDSAGNKIMQANITVRVPSDQLDAALAQIHSYAVEVKTETITGQDVTAEFTDLESRLRNLEATEAQLTKIMDSATKTEDVLAVFNQLTYIREQIEQVKGQMKYYSESARLSAVSVELIADALAQPITIGGWRAEGVVKDAIEALVRAFQGLATAAIWLGVYVLPLALAILLPLYGLMRLFGRRSKGAVKSA
jgi:hypothetical protein